MAYINDEATYADDRIGKNTYKMAGKYTVAVSAGDTLNFSCTSHSELPTNIVWKTESNAGALANEMVQHSFGKQHQYLTWKRPALLRDSGVYSCTASNRNGAKTSHLKLNVARK